MTGSKTMQQFITILFLLLIACAANADVVFQDLYGRKTRLSSLSGQWIFINYWASWCQPCVDEIPELNRFYEHNKNQNVAMFGVNYDALPVKQQKLLTKQLNIHYPTLKQDPAAALHLGDIRGVPVTFVFNPQGQLSQTLYGPQTVYNLERIIQ